MLSYEVYKVMHYIGLFMTFFALGALFLRALTGQPLPKKGIMILHGLGLFLVLTGGFGLLARLNMVHGFPKWVLIKLVIWLSLGVLVPLFLRKTQFSKHLWALTLFLGFVAAYLAVFKPVV